MKKVNYVFLVLLSMFVFAMIGCVTTPPVEQQFSSRWEKTKKGMSLEEFKAVWPEAKYRGEQREDDKVGEFYIFEFKPSKFATTSIEGFLFIDSKLIYWTDGKKITDGQTVVTREEMKTGKTIR